MVIAFGGTPVAAGEAERDYIELGVGYSDVFDDNQDEEAAEFSLAYRPNPRYLHESLDLGDWWRGLGPIVGARTNSDSGSLVHAGLFLDIRPDDRLVIWPSVSVGAWNEGASRDLGGTLEFMEELYVGYRLPWNDMIGVAYQHVSNAGLQETNPGHDTVLATYTISFGPLF